MDTPGSGIQSCTECVHPQRNAILLPHPRHDTGFSHDHPDGPNDSHGDLWCRLYCCPDSPYQRNGSRYWFRGDGNSLYRCWCYYGDRCHHPGLRSPHRRPGIKKFQDGSPVRCADPSVTGSCVANNLGQYIPLAVPDITTFTKANGFKTGRLLCDRAGPGPGSG